MSCCRTTGGKCWPSPTAARKRRSSLGTQKTHIRKLRDRNLLHRALVAGSVDREGLSIDDLRNRLLKQWDHAGLFGEADTAESRDRKVQESILREALTDERRLSLSGVGLVTWTVKIPADVHLPETMGAQPWNLTEDEARNLLRFLLDELRVRRAMELPNNAGAPPWDRSMPVAATGVLQGQAPRGRGKVFQWGGRSIRGDVTGLS